MIDLKDIKKKIISDVTKIVAERYNAKESEVKVSFNNSGVLKATIAVDLSSLNCIVEVKEN